MYPDVVDVPPIESYSGGIGPRQRVYLTGGCKWRTGEAGTHGSAAQIAHMSDYVFR